MRIGVLTRGEVADLDWAKRLGFRSIEWMSFQHSGAGPDRADWKSFADRFSSEAAAQGIRISAIGALYQNPLDPKQTESGRAVFHRAIEVASHIGVNTVAGFCGAVIETEVNGRGGHLTCKPLEDFLPQVVAFWDPIARFAADRGVRIAFEHCPQGIWHLPVMHYNLLGQPALWERFFNESSHANLGLEWDPSHLICQFIDPVANVHRFGSRIFHVHAKDAYINRQLLAAYGICHPGVAEHRFPGFGQANWSEIIHALVAAGYDSDLNIEGWHDPVFRNHAADHTGPLAGRQLEEAGLLTAKRTLEQYTVGLGD